MPFSSPNAPLAFRRILNRNLVLPLVLGVASALVFLGLLAYLVSALGEVERTDRILQRASAAQKLDLDMESGVRGFLVAGDERFLQPYDRALAGLTTEMERLKADVRDNPPQVERIERIQAMQERWNKEFAQEQVRNKRQDPGYVSRSPLGRELKDAIREEFDQFFTIERRLRAERTQSANQNTLTGAVAFVIFMLGVGGLIAWRGRRDLMGLSATYEQAFAEQERQAATLQAHAWLREGQSRLSERLAGEQQLQGVGHGALEALSQYAGIAVGALYTPEPDGGFRRAATWGWSADAQAGHERLPAGRTLVAECAAQRRPIKLDTVPPGYLKVASALGEALPGSVLLSPVLHEGRLSGVLEVGWMRPLEPRDEELLVAAGNVLGSAIESARYRERLQEALDRTQQLNEELQVQQEELRTANEELEEQSKALKESQAHLESQQAELEQTNVQLSEQADKLENQRDQLREAQVALEERAAELQRASRYKSEFLANMSHELRTPLNSSLILAKLLADNTGGNLTEEQVKFADSIYNAGNDLLNLINDILDIAKVEAGKLEVRAEATPVASVTSGLRGMFEPLAARKGLQLEVSVAEDAPASLFTDRQRLEQILRNLMANALKFTENGSVAVHVARQPGDRIAFEVRDSGIGIPASQQEVIFEAFRQADGTSSRRYGGTGLGLSISRDLARLLGGDISVTSAPGQGSTFTVVLPLEYKEGLAQQPLAMAPPVASEAPAAAQPAPTPAPTGAPRPPAPAFPDDREQPANGRRTVLVVEDDVRFAAILFDLAHELGYRCLVAHEAQEGCQLAMEHIPDAVLLDILLPGDSGLSVLQRLKEDPRTRHVPVHVLSAEDRAEPALSLGAIGYARKPATREQLQEVFSRLEEKLSQKVKRVLLVEDDPRQQESVKALIGDGDVEIVAVAEGQAALDALSHSVFDCMVIDLKLPDMSGQELLRRMAAGESRSFPPVIVYTGRNLTRDEEAELMRYSRSIIIKGARSPERLLDEVTLFLHKVETQLSSERQKMLRTARSRDKAFEGRRILVVDDDMRNIFALTSALEQKGAEVEVARNGIEALQKLQDGAGDVDMVLMDIMMPEMDGFTATREIRKDPRFQKLPVIAVTAKAMKEDQEKCLAAGANDYLAKPIELERLFSLMRVWMPKLERI
ncbi:response regulator [Ramlibacter pallidus]|uniref:histidine kinase n=1 Tax=Ramlibacter pallidus TaxID=2780087 RepID=A0ABR9RXN9_9BURK|nr:response regulator [Ramlibacter pallidus]MBE7366000.1 response regulator [Ramlibacter pallidus]